MLLEDQSSMPSGGRWRAVESLQQLVHTCELTRVEEVLQARPARGEGQLVIAAATRERFEFALSVFRRC